jgi:hypothetical protein
MTDRPRPSFRQNPAKGIAFQKTGMPFTVTTAKESICREGIAPSGLRAGALAHAAHTFSSDLGECFCWALQVSRCGHPLSVTFCSRVQTPF